MLKCISFAAVAVVLFVNNAQATGPCGCGGSYQAPAVARMNPAPYYQAQSAPGARSFSYQPTEAAPVTNAPGAFNNFGGNSGGFSNNSGYSNYNPLEATPSDYPYFPRVMGSYGLRPAVSKTVGNY